MKKILLSFFIIVITASFSFSQIKDNTFFNRPNDPIKLVQVYPNPATEFVTVKFEAPIANKVNLTVHNVIGNIMQLETETPNESEIRIRVKDLADGYYLISIKEPQANLAGTFKFLKR